MRRTMAMAMAMVMTTAMVACDEAAGDLELEHDQSDVESELAFEASDELSAQGQAQASSQYPQITIAAWSDGAQIRQSAYCTDYALDPTDESRCTCDGLDGLGWTGFDNGVDNKCRMCKDSGGWPCSLEPNAGTEVALSFVNSGAAVMISYLEADTVKVIDTTANGAWVLSCFEPPASCSHTCDPGTNDCTCGENSLEFAVTRPYSQGGARHMNGKGGLVIDLGDTCS